MAGILQTTPGLGGLEIVAGWPRDEQTIVVAVRLGRSKLRHYKQLGGEELAEDVADGLGVGLAAGGLHDLADEKFEDEIGRASCRERV